ncbi:DUF4307 domain-containing protein [Microbacterium stercoris]|uniref:DUF4307 domain-containing protein n=1 Tax=Microbacterium stercoris TaxID=2820289 RepID=A0A939TPB7_9MICO|nr:DUF4307 domain-containing protein [Microbacterium stercoris]MBO3662220.1 DUF4307 domain-containing protein [Microbacterium stercoris]
MTTQAQLDDRYGRTRDPRRRRIAWVAVIAAAALLVGWFGWNTVATEMDAVGVDGHGFTVVDERSVEVSFQFTAPAGRSVACAVQALSEDFGVVGWKIVQYEAADSRHQRHVETVPTVAEATTGLVESCWVT